MCTNKRVALVEPGNNTTTCPCCSTTIPQSIVSNIGFDYGRNELFRSGQTVHLTPQQADIFKVLLNRWPKLTTVDQLNDEVYGSYLERPSSRDGVIVPLCKLRKSIQKIGLGIKNYHGQGWVLAEFEPSLDSEFRRNALARYLVSRKGQLVEYQELFDYLWGNYPPLTDTQHLVRARVRKLNQKPGWKIRVVHGVGVRVDGVPETKDFERTITDASNGVQ